MSHLRKTENFIFKGIEIVGLPSSFYKERIDYAYAARALIYEVDNAIKILQEARKELETEWQNCPQQKYY